VTNHLLRRAFAVALVATALTACTAEAAPTTTPPPSSTTVSAPASRSHEFAELEKAFTARLGVYAIDTGTGREVAYRDGERFAYASTHKALSAAAVLQLNTVPELEEVVHYTAADVVSNSPVTRSTSTPA